MRACGLPGRAQANVGPRQLWPPAGRRNLGPSSLQLALRVVSRSPLTDAVPRVTLELCRCVGAPGWARLKELG